MQQIQFYLKITKYNTPLNEQNNYIKGIMDK